MFSGLIAYVRGILHRRRIQAEAEEELQFHVQRETDAGVSRGVPLGEARREALRDLGGLPQAVESVRDVRTIWLDAIWRDARYAVRTLRRTPTFTAAVLAILALVIGANTAVFSLVDAILLRPLPYPRSERLARVVWDVRSPNGASIGQSVDGRTWELVRDGTASLDLAVTAGGVDQVNFNAAAAAEFVGQARVGAGYFRVLGVVPFIGREFTSEEDRPGGPAVAVLAADLWDRVFHSDPAIVGRTVLLRGEAYEVVGVMPRGFADPRGSVDVFTPVRPSQKGEGVGTNYQVVARLRSGRHWPEADGELANTSTLLNATAKLKPGVVRALVARPLQEILTDGLRPTLQVLASAGVVLLLIACVNLAALVLARGTSRAKELATRLALGSSRAAVVRQLAIENLTLGLAGGVLGLIVGSLCLSVMQAMGGDIFVQWKRVTMDVRTVAVTAAVSILTTLVFGLVPTLRTSRIDVNQALTESGSRGVAGGSGHWGWRVLIAAEVALSVVLLVVAGLLGRTLVSLTRLDPGFDPRHVTATSVSLQDSRYDAADRVRHLFEASLAQLEQAPGVEAAAVSLDLPYSRLLNYGVRFADREPESQPPVANFMYVTPGFFDTLRIPLRSGRAFNADDRAGRPLVVVVNDSLTRLFTAGQDPVGRPLRIDGRDWDVVGVVGDMRTRSSGLSIPGMVHGPLEAPPIVFLPVAQVPDAFLQLVHRWFEPYWTVRTVDGVNAESLLRRAINQADPSLPVAPATTLSDVQRSATAFQRLMLMLVGAFAVVALLLATIGIYGLVAQTVLERTREFGIRMALGATVGDTIRGVTWSGVMLGAAGTFVGCGFAWAATRVAESFFWGVDAHDPLTFAGIAAILLVAATAASALPALRILRIDPATTLRA